MEISPIRSRSVLPELPISQQQEKVSHFNNDLSPQYPQSFQGVPLTMNMAPKRNSILKGYGSMSKPSQTKNVNFKPHETEFYLYDSKDLQKQLSQEDRRALERLDSFVRYHDDHCDKKMNSLVSGVFKLGVTLIQDSVDAAFNPLESTHGHNTRMAVIAVENALSETLVAQQEKINTTDAILLERDRIAFLQKEYNQKGIKDYVNAAEKIPIKEYKRQRNYGTF